MDCMVSWGHKEWDMTERLSIHFHKKEAEREEVSSQNRLYPKAKKLVIWSWGMDSSTRISHWLRDVCSASKTDIRFPKLRTAYWQRLSVVAIESKHLPGAPVHMCDCVCPHTHKHTHTTVQETQGMWAEHWKYLLQFYLDLTWEPKSQNKASKAQRGEIHFPESQT